MDSIGAPVSTAIELETLVINAFQYFAGTFRYGFVSMRGFLLIALPVDSYYTRQVGFFYVVAAVVYSHLAWGIDYSMLYFERVNALALVAPYLGWIVNGVLIGCAIVLAGLVMPRKVLVTDGALVVKMQSPLFFRIPLQEIENVEPVDTWKAWWNLIRLRALPLYPWFFRGLLIHRKSGRPVLLHTKDDDGMRAVLSAYMPFDRTVATANGEVEPETQALEPCQARPLRSLG